MLDNIKKILNEDQDPKAIDKITSKLENLLMTNETVGYIAVQKKPALTVFPDSVIVTNKRIIICKPKNLGLSMDFIDYDWDDVEGSFIKEGFLGSEFTFNTKSGLTLMIDYLPKNQARKLYTYAKEQHEIFKNPSVSFKNNDLVDKTIETPEIVEEIVAEEEVTHFAQLVTNSNDSIIEPHPKTIDESSEKQTGELSKEALFEKLQNYKRLLDNGLIMQAEYDQLKKEIISLM